MPLNLDPKRVSRTIIKLNGRIDERFPDSGLSIICKELLAISISGQDRIVEVARPNIILRVLVGLVVTGFLLTLGYSISFLDIRFKSMGVGDFIQITEATINNLVLIGAALFFLITFETRVKRRRALDAIHELRTIAHVIDMSQLTKDPSRLYKKATQTRSSPQIHMSPYELIRYLDYCGEMLSLTGKLAALYAEHLQDAIVVSSVNEVENLTTDLSQKIWQKIMIIHRFDPAEFSGVEKTRSPNGQDKR